MDIIEENTLIFFKSITELDKTKLIESLIIIMNFLERRMLKSGLNLEIKPIERMTDIFLSLNPLLTSTFKTRVIEKIVSGKESHLEERIVETTFNDIFMTYIKSRDWHKCTVKNVLYVCDFHEESLFCHSIMTCISSVWYLLIKNNEVTNRYVKFIAATSLLHDIGKPASMDTGIVTIGDKCKRTTKFPTHALIGGLILQKSYSDAFGFEPEEWDDLCRLATIHMCGYNCTDENSPVTQSKWFRLSMEKANVKNGLVCLSIGDIIGTIRSDKLCKDEELFNSRNSFEQSIQTKLEEPSKIFSKLGTSGLIIVIVGSSAAGKSTLSKKLTEYLNNQDVGTTYVSRDDIMLEMCCPLLGIEVSQTAYAQCYEYVQKNDMGKEIDEQVKLLISNAITFNEVCIIDTVAAMYRKNFNSYFSDDVLSCEILQIFVDRNILHTLKDAERLGLTLERQITLSGLSDLLNPLAKMDMANIAGLGCATETWNMKRDYSNRSQCTLSASVVWNSEYIFGLAHVYQLLHEISAGLKKGIVKRVDSQSMNVVEYVNYIYGLYECDFALPIDLQLKLKFDALHRRFAVQHFVVSKPNMLRDTPYENRIFSVKYRDGINKLWRPTWARQCRGVCFYVCDDFTCIPIKYQLQRGAELMSGMLVSANIASTQDISDAKKIACLSNSQQRTCKILLTDENDGLINAHLTEKIDGSLLTVTFYYGETALLMKMIVTTYGDDFSKMILTGFEKYGLVGVVSTQGTLMMGIDMQDYFVTSNLESPIVSLERSFLTEQVKIQNIVQLFDRYGKPWFDKMVHVLQSLPYISKSVSNISLCWESVCAGRETILGKLHTELAISYSRSMCLFLGASWCGKDYVLNVPHTMLSLNTIQEPKDLHSCDITMSCDVIHPKLMIHEPRFWIIKSSKEVDSLMRGLEDVVYGYIDDLEFLKRFPPSNKVWDKKLPLHPEGYVCYTCEGEFMGQPLVDYNKLKLAAYYIGHKFHDESICELYKLSKTASHIFPMAKIVGDFYSKIKVNFFEIGQKISQAFEPENIFASKLEGKASKTYSTASRETQAKMIINAKIDLFDTWIKNLIVEYFPVIITTDLEPEKIKSGLKRMCMDLKPWINYEIQYPPEFQEIIDDPVKFSGITSVFFMIMHQQ